LPEGAHEEANPVTREISASFAASIADDISTEVLQLISLPPTLPWESSELYFKMIASFAEALEPDDLISWMLIKDLADHRLEIARYRAIKAGFVKTACDDQIRSKQSSSRTYADDETSRLKKAAETRFSTSKRSSSLRHRYSWDEYGQLVLQPSNGRVPCR
jgi:hypothetical protein